MQTDAGGQTMISTFGFSFWIASYWIRRGLSDVRMQQAVGARVGGRRDDLLAASALICPTLARA